MTCPFKDRCHPIAKASREAMLARLRPKTVAKPAEAAAPGPTGSALPKKVMEWMQRIERAGIQVAESIRGGRNPFKPGQCKHLYIACQFLLGCKGGFYRSLLQKQLEKHCGWSEGTAAAHALQAVQILKAYHIADEVNGVVKMRAA